MSEVRNLNILRHIHGTQEGPWLSLVNVTVMVHAASEGVFLRSTATFSAMTSYSYAQKLKHVEESLNLEGTGEILCLYLLINLINGSYPHKRSAKMSLY